MVRNISLLPHISSFYDHNFASKRYNPPINLN